MRLLKLFATLTALVICSGQSSQPVYEIDYIGTPTSCAAHHGITCTDISSYPYVYADAYNLSGGDGGGGYFYMNNSITPCPYNNGTVVHDGLSPTANCFYRANPTNDVREWGAKCDVVPVANVPATPTQWVSSLNAIVVPAAELPAATSAFYPKAGQFITATQIGNPPQWADRWSTLAKPGTAYKSGDLLTFTNASGGSTGSFSQQIAISVDQVADSSNNIEPPGTAGEIFKWHFIWGGQYTSLPSPATGLTVDTAHSFTGGTSATFNPAWSGWSVMDQNSGISAGSSYTAGSTVSFNYSGGTANQNHYPEIVVMAVSSVTGGITA